MASLGSIFAAEGIGAGLSQAPVSYLQGQKDRMALNQSAIQNAQQQKVWDYQDNEMNRMRQQQGIEDSSVEGATDEDRLNKLADIAGQAGRGDLQRKYKGAALQARQGLQMQSIASASKAITLGQFGPATDQLNQTGLFGKIHSIAPTSDPNYQDPRNPGYDVYTEGPPDAQGNPTQGPHVIVTQQMLYQLQSKPEDALRWLNYAQNMGQRNDTKQDDLAERKAYHDALLKEREANDNMKMSWHSSVGGGRGASGRLPNMQWIYAWAQKPKEQGGGGMSPEQAMDYATDPTRLQKEWSQRLRTGMGVSQGFGGFSPEDVVKNANAIPPFQRSPIGAATPIAPTPIPVAHPKGIAPPEAPAGPIGVMDRTTFGKNPRFPNSVWSPKDKGWFQKVHGQIVKVE